MNALTSWRLIESYFGISVSEFSDRWQRCSSNWSGRVSARKSNSQLFLSSDGILQPPLANNGLLPPSLFSFSSCFCLPVFSEVWWLSGGFSALRSDGRRFECRSSRYVRTLGKSFTRSCLYEVMWRPVLLPCGKFDSCNNLLSSVHTLSYVYPYNTLPYRTCVYLYNTILYLT